MGSVDFQSALRHADKKSTLRISKPSVFNVNNLYAPLAGGLLATPVVVVMPIPHVVLFRF
jgi:hypothetical protein